MPTNEEIYRDLSVEIREGRYGQSIRFDKFMNLVSIDKFTDELMNRAREDEADNYADVMKRESYRVYMDLLERTNGNGNEEDEKQRAILAVEWLEDVLEYFINKHDGECIKIEITNTYQR